MALAAVAGAAPPLPAGYVHAAASAKVPAKLAYLAALQRSGVVLDNGCKTPWPWTLSSAGQSHYYPSRADAHAALLAAIHRQLPDIQVGLLQVPVTGTEANIVDLLDPQTNLALGLPKFNYKSRALNRLSQRFDRLGWAGFCQPVKRAANPPKQPQQIADLVARLAPAYTLDPALVTAVIAQESGFNPKARSPKQAQGLMQLLPTTAQRFGVRFPFDPEDNLRGGMAYLHWLLRRFQGDVALTLAAYNAGENAVARYQGIPPYPETRQYVHSIMANYPRTQHPVPPPLG
ncbi:MAG: lytic transglycosylase domain-containing protein [Candidatus Paceibacterota bacterium]|jgi:soluble lytic murein transglycosylase-like protein